MSPYEEALLKDFHDNLEANHGHLDTTGQALLRAIGRGSPELFVAVEKMLDHITGLESMDC